MTTACSVVPVQRGAPRLVADPLKVPAKIAFAGDWHADLSWAVAAVYAAHDHHADVIIHTGDFGYTFDQRYLKGLTTALAYTKTPLLFVDGNHEDHAWLAAKPLGAHGLRQLTPWIWHLPRGYRWTWGGVRFLALGGAHSVDGMWRRRNRLLWQPQERVSDETAAKVIAAGRADVMVSHDCPDGVDIPGLHDNDFPEFEIACANDHRRLIRRIVERVQPAAIWHGHYHRRYRRRAQLGYGTVHVTGLDMNGTTMKANLDIVDITALSKLAVRQ